MLALLVALCTLSVDPEMGSTNMPAEGVDIYGIVGTVCAVLLVLVWAWIVTELLRAPCYRCRRRPCECRRAS